MNFPFHERDAALVPKNIAIQLLRDPAGRLHWRSAKLTSYAASRFTGLQVAFLDGGLTAPTRGALAALSLILLDGIANRDDLERALAGVDHLHWWNERVCLTWDDSIGRHNRRFLSPITQSVLALPTTEKLESAAVMEQIDALLRSAIRSAKRTYSLELLLLDAQAWLLETVPGPLFAHCTGHAPISALPLSALARQEAKLALAPETAGQPVRKTNDGFARALGNYFDHGQGNEGGFVIDELISTCRRDRSPSDSSERQRMLKDCSTLLSLNQSIGPIPGLVLAWAYDLLESGTRTKTRVRAATASKYIAALARPLLEAFRDLDIESLPLQSYREIYLGMMEGGTDSKKRTLASAISSWHHFLSCWFEVPPLYPSLHKLVPAARPKANLLWQHELDQVAAWLDEPIQDDRHRSQLKVAFGIARAIRIRAGELLSLRLRNFHFEPGRMTIEIATPARDGGVKTPSGVRRAAVECADGIATIQAWHARRVAEGGLKNDYLFGDPYRPDRRYQPGLLYADLNRLLKAATGDRTIALHALSHTRISFDWDRARRERRAADIDPIERESVLAGHASPATGFATYFHFSEGWLRDSLDARLSLLFTRWPCIRDRVGKSHEAFRQARSRCRRADPAATDEAFATRKIAEAAPCLLIPHVANVISLTTATNPLVASPWQPLTLKATLDILHDIRHGYPAEAIVARSGRPSAEIEKLARQAIVILQRIGEADPKIPAVTLANPLRELSQRLQSSTRHRIQFERTGQAKAALLIDEVETGDRGEVVIRAAAGWESCYRAGYLSLTPPDKAAAIIRLLDKAGSSGSLMVVRGIPQEKDNAMAMFCACHKTLPRWEAVEARRGRPDAYLLLASRDGSLGNAALGTGGIHAVLFAALLVSRIQPKDA